MHTSYALARALVRRRSQESGPVRRAPPRAPRETSGVRPSARRPGPEVERGPEEERERGASRPPPKDVAGAAHGRRRALLGGRLGLVAPPLVAVGRPVGRLVRGQASLRFYCTICKTAGAPHGQPPQTKDPRSNSKPWKAFAI